MKKLFVMIMAVCLLSGAGISDARYLDNGDGTVSDTQTGLMWQKTAASDKMNWNDALRYCQGLSLAGHSDWRLPDIDTLMSLVDVFYRPAIHPDYFPDTSSAMHWSSTPYATYSYYAWVIDFYDSHSYSLSKASSMYVRAVRGGEPDTGSFGSLVIHIEPEKVRNAGAQWRRAGTNTWYNSGDAESNIPAGLYTVEFNSLSGWTKPDDINVIVNSGQSHSATSTYTLMGVILHSDFSFVVPKMIYNLDTDTYMELEAGFKFVGEQNGKLMWELDYTE